MMIKLSPPMAGWLIYRGDFTLFQVRSLVYKSVSHALRSLYGAAADIDQLHHSIAVIAYRHGYKCIVDYVQSVIGEVKRTPVEEWSGLDLTSHYDMLIRCIIGELISQEEFIIPEYEPCPGDNEMINSDELYNVYGVRFEDIGEPYGNCS